ncbi:MAG: 4Fe-4S dicluster domain-containing protein [Planctomycetes bacterium]|nr:4Fe-4S dicluster domain-containing protein [Planctomycetota bacterium]
MSWTRRAALKNLAALAATALVGLKLLRPGKARSVVIRPPGALPEPDFLATCIRCGRCADACPNRCITTLTPENGKVFSVEPGAGDEGTPVIFPRQQACNLCGSLKEAEYLRCTAACPTGALGLIRKTPEALHRQVALGVARVDTNLCHSYNGRSCGVCIRACPFEGKALRAGILETPILDPAWCVGCGLCERSCIRYPQAIVVVPDPVRGGRREGA